MDERTPYHPPLADLEASDNTTPPWYRSSYLFVLLAFFFLHLGWWPLVLACLFGVLFNLRHHNWYRSLWPWLLIVLFAANQTACSLQRTLEVVPQSEQQTSPPDASVRYSTPSR